MADANAENGLTEAFYHNVESMRTQIRHSATGLALSGKHHLVGFPDKSRVIGKQGVYAQAAQRVDNTVNIARIIFYYDYIHLSS